MIKTFTVELKDEISPNAKNASEQVRSLTSAMSSLERQAVKSAALGDANGLEKAATKYRALATEVNRLGAEFPGATSGAHGLSEATSEGSMFGALIEADLAIEGIKKIGEGLVELTKFAIESTESAKKMGAVFGDLSGTGAEGGRAILGTVRDIARGLPQSEKEVQKWAQTLMAAGVTDMSQLKGSLQAVAGAEALVEGGGEKVKGMLAKLAEQSEKGTKTKFSLASLAGTGVNESEFLRALGMTPQNFAAAKKAGTVTGEQIANAITSSITAKSAGSLGAMNEEIGTVFTKGKDTISHLFEGLDFSKIGEAVSSFFDLFDLANPSGQAIKAGIGGAISWLGDKLVWAAKNGKLLFLELELGALIAYNAVRPMVHSFLDWGASSGFLSGALDGVKYVLEGVGVAALVVIGVVAGLTAAVGLVGAGIAYVVGKVPDAIAAVLATFAEVGAGLSAFAKSGWNAAVDFVAGMVKGIVEGASSIVTAAENAAKGAISAVEHTLGIHSPSVVMVAAGRHTSEGFAQGIGQGSPGIEQASASMAARPIQAVQAVPAQASPMRGGAPGSSSESNTSNHYEIHITAKDNATAQDLVGLFEETMASLQERRALSQGLAAT